MSVHKNLTGADLHEPKGADTALSGQVYVANGSGGGVWTDATSVVTNTAFTTGDTKITLKTTADTGWIIGIAGTIGDGSSGATVRANSDTSALFTLLWTNFSNTLCPVSTGRGASAALDYAAHKTITLPDMWQRALGVAGSYNSSGQTTRTLGAITGTETVTLTSSQLPASIPYTDPGHFHTISDTQASSTAIGTLLYRGSANLGGFAIGPTASAVTGITINPSGGSSHSNMQPTVFLNLMIKL